MAIFSAHLLSAQPSAVSSPAGKLYVGLAGGFNFSTTESNLSNLGSQMNPLGGVRVGYNFSQTFGLAAEWATAFDSKPYKDISDATFKHSDLSLLGTVSLGNLLLGSDDIPYSFDILAVGGVGWGHYYGVSDPLFDKNDVAMKVGLDFAFNFGSRSEWQVYLEPAFNYAFDRKGTEPYPASPSMVSLSLGVNYSIPMGRSHKKAQTPPVVLPVQTPQASQEVQKAKASQEVQKATASQEAKKAKDRQEAKKSQGGQESQVTAPPSQQEIDMLNQQVSELRNSLKTETGKTAYQERVIDELRSEIDELKNNKHATSEPTNEASERKGFQLPTSLVFLRGHTAVEPSHHDAIALVVSYLANHPTARLLIKGYAVSEGGRGGNQRIAEARAQAVKDIMVNRYRVKESRLEVMGVADAKNIDEEYDFNRIVTFTDVTR